MEASSAIESTPSLRVSALQDHDGAMRPARGSSESSLKSGVTGRCVLFASVLEFSASDCELSDENAVILNLQAETDRVRMSEISPSHQQLRTHIFVFLSHGTIRAPTEVTLSMPGFADALTQDLRQGLMSSCMLTNRPVF